QRQNALFQNILRHRLHHFGVDIAGADRVHGDAALGVLERERLGEADIAGLGGRIIDLAELTLLAVDRGDVDNAAEFAGAHALDHRARHVEQRAEIGVDDRVPLIERHFVESAVLGDAGIVDEHVHRTEIGFDLLDAGGTVVERTDVPFIDGDARLGLELLGRSVIAGVARRHLVACRFQRLADCGANATGHAPHPCNTCHASSLDAFYGPELSPVFQRSSIFTFEALLNASETKMLGARPGIPIFYQLAPWLTDDLFIIQPITLPVVQSRAMHIAMPMPPPIHSVARPFLASRFCISCSSVTSTRVPEARTGWPIAIAPPLRLTFDVSQPRSTPAWPHDTMRPS